MRKILKGFSLVELMVALIVVSCITAMLTPHVIKKMKSSTITVGASESESGVSKNCTEKFGEDCSLCYTTGCILCTKTCDAGQILDNTNCACKGCGSFGSGCVECSETSCTRCSAGYGIQAGQCVKCDAGYYSDGFRGCAPCLAGNYQADEGQLSCNPCPSGQYQDETGKSSCKTCAAGTYQTESGKTSCNTCEIDYACSGGASHVQCATNMGADAGSSVCSNCPSNCKDCNVPAACLQCNPGYYISGGGCIVCPAGSSCDGTTNQRVCGAGTYAVAGSSSCATCSSKTPECAECDSQTGECSVCKAGFKLNSEKKCVELCDGIDCGDSAKCIKTSDTTVICATKYNMLDTLDLSSSVPSGMATVVMAGFGTSCSPTPTERCCWKGETSRDCDTTTPRSTYSGCNRTLCSWYAAEAICGRCTYGGRTWRLPTVSEVYSIFSYTLEDEHLFCDSTSSMLGLPLCASLYDGTCMGAAEAACLPSCIWGENLNTNEANSVCVLSGHPESKYRAKNYAIGVRCVSDVEL